MKILPLRPGGLPSETKVAVEGTHDDGVADFLSESEMATDSLALSRSVHPCEQGLAQFDSELERDTDSSSISAPVAESFVRRTTRAAKPPDVALMSDGVHQSSTSVNRLVDRRRLAIAAIFAVVVGTRGTWFPVAPDRPTQPPPLNVSADAIDEPSPSSPETTQSVPSLPTDSQQPDKNDVVAHVAVTGSASTEVGVRSTPNENASSSVRAGSTSLPVTSAAIDLPPVSVVDDSAAETPRPATQSVRPTGTEPIELTADSVVDDRAGIERTLHRYQRAYRELDAPAAVAVWPTVDARALKRAFASVQEQDLVFNRCDIAASPDSATARCVGEVSYVRRVGNATRRAEQHTWTIRLARAGHEWNVVSLSAH